MRPKDSLMLLASRALLRHASHVCPPARASWITAAANELGCMAEARESLYWSIGTVQASYKERFRAMSLNEPQLPGFVLMLEVLLCFLPSTLLWVCAMEAIVRNGIPLRDGLSLSSAASIGPTGLLIFGQVALGIRSSKARWRSLTLTSLAGWTAFVVLVSPLTPLPLGEMSWRDCVLLVLLPFIGAAHYGLLERKSRPSQPQGSSHLT